MTEVRPFGADMFEDYARERGLEYLVDGGGSYLVRLAGEDDVPALDCWLRSEDDGRIASVRIVSRERLLADAAFVMVACDAWNRTYRWPKAYTLECEGVTEIVLEGDLIVACGVTDDWLAVFIDVNLAGAFRFWEEFSVGRRLNAA